MNYLYEQGDEIHNVYLNADNCEKVWLRDCHKFGELEVKNFIFKKALYGIKPAGS